MLALKSRDKLISTITSTVLMLTTFHAASEIGIPDSIQLVNSTTTTLTINWTVSVLNCIVIIMTNAGPGLLVAESNIDDE